MAEKPGTHPIDEDKTIEQLFAERNQRVVDATLLKRPDRIPVFLGMGYMLAELGHPDLHAPGFFQTGGIIHAAPIGNVDVWLL